MPLELQRSFRLYVTHVEGAGPFLKICGQLDQPSSLMVESLFETARVNLENGFGSVPPGAIKNGKICAAKYKDGAYYRAKIISTANLSIGLVGVHFIDYGNRDIIPVNAVRLLDSYDPMFQRIPGQANDFYLARVMNLSGLWEESVLQHLQHLLCYAEYTASVDSMTHALPIISIQLKDEDFSTHVISNRLGVAIPVPKQRMMLVQTEVENIQASIWQQNYKVEFPTNTDQEPHSVNQNLPSDLASAMFLQKPPPVPSLAPAPMSINQRLVVNNTVQNLTSFRTKNPLQVAPNRPLLEPSRMQTLPTKKAATYKSRLLECNSQHKVFVSFIEDGPELFAVQPLDNFKQFQNMMDNINSMAHTSLTELPMIGSVCLGRISEDRIICRAIVTNLSGSQCKLHFVDLGDTELVSYYDIFEIPEEFMKQHIFSMRFCLSGVKNLPKGPYLNEAFKKLVSGKLLTLRVVAPEGPPLIQYGELYLDNKNVLDLLAAHIKNKLHFKWVDMLQLGGRYSVLVSYVDNCLKFYIQLTDQTDRLNAVMQSVKAHCENTLSPGELPVGAACCARFADDGKWYRARVRSTKQSKVVVAYVDYGNEQEVAVSDLRTITPDLIQLPAQAIKCALKGFESTSIEAKTSNLLEKLALEKTLTANVLGVLPSLTKLVALTDDTISPPLDVAQEIQRLIEMEKMPPPVRAPAPAPVPDACVQRLFGRENSNLRRRNQTEEAPAAAQNWRMRTTENNNGFERFGTARHGDAFPNRSDFRQSDRENKDPFPRITVDRHTDTVQDRPDHRQSDRDLGRIKVGRHTDTVQDRPDHRQSDRRGAKPWEPIDDWREALEPRPRIRERYNKLHKQDDKEVTKPEERLSGSRDSWGERGEGRAERRDEVADKKELPKGEYRGDRSQQRSTTYTRERSFGSDRSGGSRHGRRAPNKPRGASTPPPPRELAAPVPLDTLFADPSVEPGAEHEVAVTWIASPHSFYVQILALQPKFHEMMHRIPDLYKSVRPYGGSVAVGASVLARYPADGVLYRATVVDAQPLSKFVVQYVDFGNKQLVDAKDIWQLERQLTELPRMAVHCSLLGVAAPDGGWRAGPELDQCFSAPRYRCVFAERAEDAQRVSLWSNGASVADALVDKALAVRADQPQPVALKDEAVDLTIVAGQQIPCRVTHVHSFDKFYVQLDLEKAALVEEAVAGFDASLLTPLAADSLADGVHCTVRHEGRVFRAILTDTADPARVAAVLPDYGRTVTTSLDQLMILPTELSVYYYQSLECCLNNYSAESRRLLTEDELKTRLVNNKFIVYIDNVEGSSLVTTLYDIATGQKLALFEPDEGAFDEVTPLCPRTVLSYNFGLASVQHLENLNEIHLQRAADLDRVQALLDSLFTFCEEGAPEPLTEFAADTLCAAKSSDENWYRAVIVSASDDAATVQFPDYGNKETVPKSLLKKLDPRFHEPCALALEVALGLEARQEAALAPLAEWTADREVQVTLACDADGWLASLRLEGEDLSLRLVDEQLAAPRTAAAMPSECTAPAAPAEPEGAAVPPPPPGCVQAYISHIDTPGHFWLQLTDRVARIDEVQAALQAGAAAYPALARRELGTLCAVKYSADELWYRAQVLDLDADITTVRFVDYGNTDVLVNQPGVVKELPEALATLEPLALRSSVNAVPTGTGQWSEAASDSFAALVGDTEAPVDALVVLKDETAYVDLFVGGQNVTDRLVALGHAARAEQPECGDLPACFASHVNSLSEFWIQLESATEELQAMDAAMVDAEHFPALPSREEGVLCAAKYPEDGSWYRAQVIVDGSEGTEVLFMDYGNASIASELRSLPPELKVKPALSRKCALQKPRDVKAWSRHSESKFNELTAEGTTFFNVQFITAGDISIVELYLEGRSVTEQLVWLCEQRLPAERPAPDDVSPEEVDVATAEPTIQDLIETDSPQTLNEELDFTNKIDSNEHAELVGSETTSQDKKVDLVETDRPQSLNEELDFTNKIDSNEHAELVGSETTSQDKKVDLVETDRPQSLNEELDFTNKIDSNEHAELVGSETTSQDKKVDLVDTDRPQSLNEELDFTNKIDSNEHAELVGSETTSQDKKVDLVETDRPQSLNEELDFTNKIDSNEHAELVGSETASQDTKVDLVETDSPQSFNEELDFTNKIDSNEHAELVGPETASQDTKVDLVETDSPQSFNEELDFTNKIDSYEHAELVGPDTASQDIKVDLAETDSPQSFNEELDFTNKIDSNEHAELVGSETASQDKKVDLVETDTPQSLNEELDFTDKTDSNDHAEHVGSESAVDSGNEEPGSTVKMHKEEDEFEDANELNSSKLEESFQSSDTVMEMKSFESNPEISDNDDKFYELESMEKDTSSETLENSYDSIKTPEQPVQELLAEVCLLAGFDANVTNTLDQSVPGDRSTYIDCEPENAANLSTVKVNFTATPETISQNTDDTVYSQISDTEDSVGTDNSYSHKIVSNDMIIESVVPLVDVDAAIETVASNVITGDSDDVKSVFCASKPENVNESTEETDFATASIEATSNNAESIVPFKVIKETEAKESVFETIDSTGSTMLPDEIDLTKKLDSIKQATEFNEKMNSTAENTTVVTILTTDSEAGSTTTSNNENVNNSTERDTLAVMFETISQDKVTAVPSLNSEIEESQKTSENILEVIDTINKSESEALQTNTDDPTESVELNCVTVQDIFSIESGESVIKIEPMGELRNDIKPNLSYSKSDEGLESIHNVIKDNSIKELCSLNSGDDKSNQLVLPDKDMSSVTFDKTNDTIATPEMDEQKDSINTDTGYMSSGDASLSEDNSLLRDSSDATAQSSQQH